MITVLKQLINERLALIQNLLFVSNKVNTHLLIRPEAFITICCIFVALLTICCCRGRTRSCYVLHFNGSDINQHNKGGAGCIIRNKDEVVVAGAYNLDNLNKYPKQFHVAIAGAEALRNGLKLAEKYGVKLRLIKGKNEEVINRVLGRQRRPPEVPYLTELIDEIKEALDEQSIDVETQVKLIGEEEGNEVAHGLANYGSNMLKFGSEEIYSGELALPAKVAQLLPQDKRMWSAETKFM